MSVVYQDEVKGLDEEYVVYDRIIKLRGSEYNITTYEVNVDLPTDVHVPAKALRNSRVLSSIYNDNLTDQGVKDVGGDLVPLNIPTKYLGDIVEYLIHHQDDVNIEIIPNPLTSNNLKNVCKGMEHGCDQWDVDYISKFSNKDLYQVIHHANSMAIFGLLHLGCAKVASMIKGQPLENFKDILAVK